MKLMTRRSPGRRRPLDRCPSLPRCSGSSPSRVDDLEVQAITKPTATVTTSPLLMNSLNSSRYFFTLPPSQAPSLASPADDVRVNHASAAVGTSSSTVEVLEAVDVAQRRGTANDHTPTTPSVSTPPSPHGRTDAEHGAGDAGLERAELVGRADEHVLDGHHAAPHPVGRRQRDDRRPDEHADRVGAGEHEQGHERDDVVARDAEHDRRHAEHGDGDEQRAADVAARPDGRRAAR